MIYVDDLTRGLLFKPHTLFCLLVPSLQHKWCCSELLQTCGFSLRSQVCWPYRMHPCHPWRNPSMAMPYLGCPSLPRNSSGRFAFMCPTSSMNFTSTRCLLGKSWDAAWCVWSRRKAGRIRKAHNFIIEYCWNIICTIGRNDTWMPFFPIARSWGSNARLGYHFTNFQLELISPRNMNTFAKLWPNTLSPIEPLRDLNYAPSVGFRELVFKVSKPKLLRAWPVVGQVFFRVKQLKDLKNT